MNTAAATQPCSELVTAANELRPQLTQAEQRGDGVSSLDAGGAKRLSHESGLRGTERGQRAAVGTVQTQRQQVDVQQIRRHLKAAIQLVGHWPARSQHP